MKTREEALEYGLSFPDTYTEMPFHDPNWQLVRVKGSKKAFLWTYEKDGCLHLNVKTDPAWRDFWRSTFSSVIPAYQQNKEHWNTIILDGTIPDEDIRRMIAESYDLVTDSPTKRIYDAVKKNPNVCGSGLFMESIEQNPVYYDLAFEMPLHKDEVNIEEWLCRYADRRYGKPSENAHQAWLHLLEGPYRPGTNGTERSSIIAARPAVNVKKSGPNAGLGIPYSPLSVVQAEGLLLKDAGRLKGSDPYRFDIVDIQRQLMSNLGQAIHKQAAEAFRKKDKEAFALHSNRFLEMLRDADELLRTRPEFNFDKWLTQARSWGDNSEEKDLFEKDATALVTVWGADGDPLIFDY